MDLVLSGVILVGWVIGFILLNKLYNWLFFRATWWFHTLENGNYLKMNESAEERYYWEDEDKK